MFVNITLAIIWSLAVAAPLALLGLLVWNAGLRRLGTILVAAAFCVALGTVLYWEVIRLFDFWSRLPSGFGLLADSVALGYRGLFVAFLVLLFGVAASAPVWFEGRNDIRERPGRDGAQDGVDG